MFGRSKTQAVKEGAASGTDLAVSLAQDKKFRKQLLSAVGHGAAARQRAASRIGLVAAVHRLSTDKELRNELRQMAENLQNAWTQVEKKRSHKLRNFLLVFAGIGAAVAAAMKRIRRDVRRRTMTPWPIPESSSLRNFLSFASAAASSALLAALSLTAWVLLRPNMRKSFPWFLVHLPAEG